MTLKNERSFARSPSRVAKTFYDKPWLRVVKAGNEEEEEAYKLFEEGE